ncbi:MAG: ATP-binding protein [Pseudomonadota bacterium]|nr:ATP-binding protein [Pseudomonadota bacterium]
MTPDATDGAGADGGPDTDPEPTRLLVHAPRGRDAEVVGQVLRTQGLQAEVCATLVTLTSRLQSGAAAAFVTEEALAHDDFAALMQWVGGQPAWSDFPFIVLASRRTGRRPDAAAATLANLGNAVLLERPLNAETLVSAAQSAMRGRLRQYQTQRHLRAEAASTLALQAAVASAEQAQQALEIALEAAELGTFHHAFSEAPIAWNGRAREHLWLDPDQNVDVGGLLDRVHPEDRDATQSALREAVAGADQLDHACRTLAPSGMFRWIRAKGRVVRNETGEPVSFAGVTLDIGRQKKLEAEREALLAAEREARVEAERASRMKDEFLSTLSHELRTPLSAILGWTHLLGRPDARPADVAKAAATIERNARVQTRLIDDLLDVSRIASGAVQLELKPVLLPQVMDAVVQSLRPTADAKSITTVCAVGRGLQPVLADPDRLQQIVWNLLSNAIKFTSTGGHVALAVDNDRDEVVLQVSDNGAGIAADFLPHVFDRFSQAESSTARSYGGVGLGLAIVRQLTEMHGGSVTADSSGVGLGATFRVRLQAANGDGTVGRDTESQAGASQNVAGHAAADQDRRLGGLRILLVDDEADGREMLTRMLQSQGAHVDAAASAEEALHRMAAALPDVLISDIGMPRVDGYELIRRVRRSSEPQMRRIPAIALTAFARVDDAARARTAGFERHLSKPVDPAQLFKTVAAVAPAKRPA